MDNSVFNDEFNSEVSKQLEEKFGKDIDAFLADTQDQLQKQDVPLKAAKKGYLFPLVVNIASIIVVAVGLFVTNGIFNSREENILDNYIVVNSVEGKILFEYKLETEEKLQQINMEMNNIESNLRAVTAERNNLIAEIDSIVETRQAELEARMNAELAFERSRLQSSGISATEIEEQLAVIEQQKQAEIEAEKANLRAELEQQNNLDQQEYRNQVASYEAALAEIRSQRELLEDELQKSNEQIEKLAEHITGAEQNSQTLSEEAARLLELQERNQAQNLVREQIATIYRSIMEPFAAGWFEKVMEQLGILKSYLQRDSIASLPQVKDRIDIDTFIIDVITMTAESEMNVPEEKTVATAVTTEAESGPIQQIELTPQEQQIISLSRSLLDDISNKRFSKADSALDELSAYLNSVQQDPSGAIALRKPLYNLLIQTTAGFLAAETAVVSIPEPSPYEIEIKQLRATLDRIDNQLSEFSQNALNNGVISTDSELISLLETKVTVKEILSSEPVVSQYPGIANKIEQYYAALSRENIISGRLYAYYDILDILAYLGNPASNLQQNWQDITDPDSLDLLQEIISGLQQILRLN